MSEENETAAVEGESAAYDASAPVTAGDLADFSNTVAEIIGDLQERVKTLEAEVAEQQASPELDPETLPEWVEWLSATYDLASRIPARWAEQPHMFAELAALRAGWAAAMHKDGDRPHLSSAALNWHEALQRALARWHDGYTTLGHPADVEPLESWVEWLTTTYRLEHRIPQRWEKIPGAVEELEALRASWRAAYSPDVRPKTTIEAGQWHEALERCLRRLHDTWANDHVKREIDDAGRGILPDGGLAHLGRA